MTNMSASQRFTTNPRIRLSTGRLDVRDNDRICKYSLSGSAEGAGSEGGTGGIGNVQNLFETLYGRKTFFIDKSDDRGGVDKVTFRLGYDPVDDILGRPRSVSLGVVNSRKFAPGILRDIGLSLKISVKR